MAATFLLPEVVGLAVAREMLTGRVLRVEAVLAVGLVNQIFPPTTSASRSCRSRRPSLHTRRSPPG